MIIDQGAWHLRLCRFTYGEEYQPRNLCKYFWSVVLAAPVQTVKGLVTVARGVGRIAGRPLQPLSKWEGFSQQTTERLAMGLGGILVITVSSSVIFLLIRGVLAVGWWMLAGLGIGLGSIAACTVVTVALVQTIQFINECRPHMTARAKIPPKSKSVGDSTWKLVWAFLRAKKRRVCPMIEVAR